MATRDLSDRTKRYSGRAIRLYRALPKETVAQVLGRQLLRAATSVGANYREADQARSKAEFVAKMGDCLKELVESEYWLELLCEQAIFSPARLRPLLLETRELIAIFTAIIRRSRDR